MRIPKLAWKTLYPKMEVALNPTKTEAIRLVDAVQTRCRVNRLSKKDVEKCFDVVASAEVESAFMGMRHCPSHYAYGIDTTVLQILRLDDDLIGLVALRKRIEPGEYSAADFRNADGIEPNAAGYPVPECF